MRYRRPLPTGAAPEAIARWSPAPFDVLYLHGERLRAGSSARVAGRLAALSVEFDLVVLVVLWRAGLRIHEALSLMESDLDPRRGSILIKHGKGDRRREVGMDAGARAAIQPWLAERAKLPAPHQVRHSHAVEVLHEGIALPMIQRQLGHSHLSTTGTYLQGISSEEIISTVHGRRAPMMHACAGLDL